MKIHARGIILVTFKSIVSRTDIEAKLKEIGCMVLKWRDTNVECPVKVPSGAEEQMIAKIKVMQEVYDATLYFSSLQNQAFEIIKRTKKCKPTGGVYE